MSVNSLLHDIKKVLSFVGGGECGSRNIIVGFNIVEVLSLLTARNNPSPALEIVHGIVDVNWLLRGSLLNDAKPFWPDYSQKVLDFDLVDLAQVAVGAVGPCCRNCPVPLSNYPLLKECGY